MRTLPDSAVMVVHGPELFDQGDVVWLRDTLCPKRIVVTGVMARTIVFSGMPYLLVVMNTVTPDGPPRDDQGVPSCPAVLRKGPKRGTLANVLIFQGLGMKPVSCTVLQS